MHQQTRRGSVSAQTPHKHLALSSLPVLLGDRRKSISFGCKGITIYFYFIDGKFIKVSQ